MQLEECAFGFFALNFNPYCAGTSHSSKRIFDRMTGLRGWFLNPAQLVNPVGIFVRRWLVTVRREGPDFKKNR
jgi:hypothetical protein